mgnify:FL=1
MVRITNEAEGKVAIGLLDIEGGRQAERDGVRRVLTEMLGYQPLVGHNEDGKPIIEGYHVSISHTLGYVAVILSREYEVGIDIEYISDRVSRISSRFLRVDEEFTNITDKLIAWCAKETMYKLFSSEHLALKDIKVDPQSSLVTNMKRNITLKFQCECSSKYILTYTWY